MEFYEFEKTGEEVYYLNFLALALSKEPIRINLTSIYCDGETLFATDSHRLHTWKNKDLLPKGFYRVLKKTKSIVWLASHAVDMDPPDYQRVLDGDRKYIKFTDRSIHFRVAQVARALGDNYAFNIKFFMDAADNDTIMEFCVVSNTDPVYLKGTNTEALIMPIIDTAFQK